MSYIKLALVAFITAVLAWGGYTLYRSGAAGNRASVAESAVKQADAAASVTNRLQGKVNAANTRLRALEQERAAVRERLAAAERRLLDDPSSGATSDASREALSEYAASLDRDFAECRAEVAALADEAAGASEAAHALNDSWPAVNDWNAAARAFSIQGLTK